MADSFSPSNSTLDPSGLETKAIEAALSCNWDSAEEINKKIIKEDPLNIPCLNRLGRASIELEKFTQAKKIYQSVLEIDPYNPIAQKNLKKLLTIKKGKTEKPAGEVNFLRNSVFSPSFFLEEAGITKVVNLVKVAEPQKLSRLYAGGSVSLITKNRGITVTDSANNYLGVLADDTAHLLLKLIKGGNKYYALIKSVKSNGISILIRETFRSKKFRNQASFIDSSSAHAFSSENITLASYDNSSRDSSESEESEESV